jgi:hypothetical protein
MEDASQAHEVADRESCVAPSFMTADREGYSADQPSEGGSGQEEVGDKSYVGATHGGGILAVYRIRNDGMLKRLRRWPAELGTDARGGCRDEWRYASCSPPNLRLAPALRELGSCRGGKLAVGASLWLCGVFDS